MKQLTLFILALLITSCIAVFVKVNNFNSDSDITILDTLRNKSIIDVSDE